MGSDSAEGPGDGALGVFDTVVCEQRTAACLRCAVWEGDGQVPVVEAAASEPSLDRGEAGGSAAEEWRRRHARRETAIRDRHGRLSGVVLALSTDPQFTSAWAQGANGERALGKLLDPLRKEGIAVLHDRRIAGSRANMDHIVVAPAGVVVIDANNYSGRVERRDRGGFFLKKGCR